ncbi:MAG: chorismate mutase [Dehalococcoidia bacterium]|nr:chorismate mutase [Dehalococcoidia bacterium]
MTKCLAIRGATTAERNTKDAIINATTELLLEIVRVNDLAIEQIAAAWFSTTTDLNAEFPALAIRKLGWMNVGMLCAHEMSVPNSLPQCIRVLILINTDNTPEDLAYVYLKGAVGLRTQGLDS